MTTYVRSKATDFTSSAGEVTLSFLSEEVVAALPAETLENITELDDDDSVEFSFAGALDAGQQTTLTTVCNDHTAPPIPTTKNKVDATVAPTANDDTDDGFGIGSIWIDVVADKAYCCVDATAAAAVWLDLSSVFVAILDNLGTDATEALILLGKSGGGGLTEDAGLKYVLADNQLLLGGPGTTLKPALAIGAANTGYYEIAAGQLGLSVSGGMRVNFTGSQVRFLSTPRPNVDSATDSGLETTRWRTHYTRGRAFSAVGTAAASYTADAGDHMVILTAATAELVLPSIATVGDGFEMLARFEGATSRTVTPDGSDTVDIPNPLQNGWYRLIAFGPNWRMIRID